MRREGASSSPGATTALAFAALLASLVALAAAADERPARTTVNFDFGWRFSRGIEPRSAQCTYEQNANYGWETLLFDSFAATAPHTARLTSPAARRRGFIWQGATSSYQECCNECANRETCRSWDWNGRVCYVKDNADGKKTQRGRWRGQPRAVGPFGRR